MTNILANSEGDFMAHMLIAFALAFAAVGILIIIEWVSSKIKKRKTKTSN